MLDPLMAAKDAATFLSLSERTLDRYRVTGEGPRFCRVGPRRVAYRVADLHAWVEARVFAHRAAESRAA